MMRVLLAAAIVLPASLGGAWAQQTALCMNAGVQYKVGEYACIAACHGARRLARCDAAAQAATWTYVSDACPSAMINAPWPAEWTEIPAVSVMTPIPVHVILSAPTPEIQARISSYKHAYH